MKKAFVIFASVVLWIFAAAAVLAVSAFSAWNFLTKPVSSADEEFYEEIVVPRGISVKEVAADLAEKNLIRSEKAFYFAARFGVFGGNGKFSLKSGTYRIKSSMSLKEICEVLQSGVQNYIQFVIPEGFTMTKIARNLEKRGVCGEKEFLVSCRNKNLLLRYGIPAENFEGYLFPDTYFLIPKMEADEVLEIFVKNFFEKIRGIKNLNGKTGGELHEKVILASVVEREYRARDEAPLIASVFSNRLEHGIGLYSCATIEYIITEIQGKPHPEKITYDDLKIDSPYNTYKWAGLPYGPISNPGAVALDAASNPAKTGYYYFVLTDSAEGRHTFSENFDQHKAAENTSYVSKGTR